MHTTSGASLQSNVAPGLGCSTALVSTTGYSAGTGSSYTGVREYLFVNADDTYMVTVTDGDSSIANSFKLAPRTMVYATCLGDDTNGQSRLYCQPPRPAPFEDVA